MYAVYKSVDSKDGKITNGVVNDLISVKKCDRLVIYAKDINPVIVVNGVVSIYNTQTDKLIETFNI